MTHGINIQLHRKIIVGVALFAALGFSYANAAPNDLVVEFEQTPLFQEANFMPGTVIHRSVVVTNNTAEAKDIVTEAINQSDPDDLGDVLQMAIKENTTVLFDGTLADFFDEGEVLLSQIAAGASRTYVFSVSFESGADSSYQEKSLGFDILVGFAGDTEGGGLSPQGNGSSPPPPSGGDGGGGGGGGGDAGVVLRGLTISGESVHATEITKTAVTIEWDTSYRSTSRVIYGTTQGLFDFTNVPNYGYPFSTPEFDAPANPNGVLHHMVDISGLEQGTTYYFRIVSHASPDTVSFEHSFTTTGTGNTQVSLGGTGTHPSQSIQGMLSEPSSHAPAPANSLRIAHGGNTASEGEEAESSSPLSLATEKDDTSVSIAAPPSSSPFAALFAALPFDTAGNSILVLIIAIILFLGILWLSRRKAKN